jgi:N-acetyl-gamma-glutamyl-phosphate reductase
MIKVAIIGGAGYTGGELLKILLFHPKVAIIGVTSKSHSGKKVSEIHPNLNHLTDLIFEKENIAELSQKADVMFFALPAGESMKKIKDVDLSKTKVIDLSADFRFWDKNTFEETYQIKHFAPDVITKCAYGLSEVNKNKIKQSSVIANPGCFPTAAILGLYPLAKEKMLTNLVIINGVTGSSGSGVKPTERTHHPERAHDFKAYNIFSHHHSPEIKQSIDLLQGLNSSIAFVPHSAPIIRGIFITAYVTLPFEEKIEKIKALYQETYKDKPFIRLVDNARISSVVGSNFCDIAVYAQKNQIVITTAIDNLIKGASGQAVQNMNIIFELPETTGLLFAGLHP